MGAGVGALSRRTCRVASHRGHENNAHVKPRFDRKIQVSKVGYKGSRNISGN